MPSCSIGFWVARDEEGRVERVGRACRGDVPLLHRFEERGLGLGRGAVDLVGQHDVREDRPRDEAEDPLPRELVLLNHLRPRDVGGHQVGGELDAVELEVHRLGERRDDQRLGQPGDADEQHVPIGHHRRQDAVDDVLLTDDALLHGGAELIGDLAGAAEELDIPVGFEGRKRGGGGGGHARSGNG